MRKKLILTFFIVFEGLLMVSPFGFIQVGAISITTLHLPVIIASFLLGKNYGAIAGFFFGLFSLIKASFTGDLSAFMFSPFVTIGGNSGNFYSLILVFVPRIILGYFAGLLLEIFKKWLKNFSYPFVAFISTLIHTVLVLGGMYLFFLPKLIKLFGLSGDKVFIALMGVLTSNGLLEALLATLISALLIPTIKHFQKKLSI